MRCAVLVNEVDELKRSMTTTLILERLASRGHEVVVLGVADCGVGPSDDLWAIGKRLPPQVPETSQAFIEMLRQLTKAAHDLSGFDVLLMRTNPARDMGRFWAHDVALSFAHLAATKGLVVQNHPASLRLATNKLFLSYLPEKYRPRGIITRNRAQVVDFVRAAKQPCVLKPLHGTHGRDVFFIRSEADTNLPQLVEVLGRGGFAVVQEYLPEAAEGDTRVIVMDGQIFRVGGHDMAFRRIPRGGDFRSNVAAGGRTEQANLSSEMRQAAEDLAGHLRGHGFFLAGLDFIGNKVVEVNVFAPGGFRAGQKYCGQDFAGAFIAAIETQASKRS